MALVGYENTSAEAAGLSGAEDPNVIRHAAELLDGLDHQGFTAAEKTTRPCYEPMGFSVVWVRGLGIPPKNNLTVFGLHRMLTARLHQVALEVLDATGPRYFALRPDIGW